MRHGNLARPMQLWQMDVMGGVELNDSTELKVVTGVDDQRQDSLYSEFLPVRKFPSRFQLDGRHDGYPSRSVGE